MLSIKLFDACKYWLFHPTPQLAKIERSLVLTFQLQVWIKIFISSYNLLKTRILCIVWALNILLFLSCQICQMCQTAAPMACFASNEAFVFSENLLFTRITSSKRDPIRPWESPSLSLHSFQIYDEETQEKNRCSIVSGWELQSTQSLVFIIPKFNSLCLVRSLSCIALRRQQENLGQALGNQMTLW